MNIQFEYFNSLYRWNIEKGDIHNSLRFFIIVLFVISLCLSIYIFSFLISIKFIQQQQLNKKQLPPFITVSFMITVLIASL